MYKYFLVFCEQKQTDIGGPPKRGPPSIGGGGAQAPLGQPAEGVDPQVHPPPPDDSEEGEPQRQPPDQIAVSLVHKYKFE